MTVNALNMSLLVCVSIAFLIADSRYQSPYIHKSALTLITLTAIYVIHKLFEEVGLRRIKDGKTRYSFRKALSIISSIVFLFILLGIWVENTQVLLVSYGLIAAGFAITLQDVFKNFVGGFLIALTGIYRVGDRIQLDSTVGDVIDVGILYTTLLELRGWVDGEQATGRLVTIPNSKILSNPVVDYNKDHNFLWDEISLPITYDSDWKKAADKILGIVKRETFNLSAQAEAEISRLGEKYYLTKRPTEPAVFLTPTDNWVKLNIRYVTELKERRFLRDRLHRLILKEIQDSGDINIASETIDVTAFPEVRMKK